MYLQVSQLALKHALVHGWYGKALKTLHKQMEDKPSKELDKKCTEVRLSSAVNSVTHPKLL